MNNKPRFIVDKMFGRLAKLLRVLGYDTLYYSEKDDTGLIMQSLKDNRIIVTGNQNLSSKRGFRIVYIKSNRLNEQYSLLSKELALNPSKEKLLTRCSICNGLIEEVPDKRTVKNLVPEYVFKTQNIFQRCSSCGKIYWKGTHLDLILQNIEKNGIKIS